MKFFLYHVVMKLNIKNETSRLRSVVLGIANSNGPIPTPEACYDPKSRLHVLNGTYPKEADMISELDEVAKVFEKYNIEVYRPKIIENYNQIFARDICFVIEDKMFLANILPDREREVDAIEHVWSQVEKSNRIRLPENCHIEGGDVMLWNEYLFIGTYLGADYSNYITARTNMAAINALRDYFPEKKIKYFNLRKSNTDPFNNALHLDCCFQPIGTNKAIIHKNGFLDEEDYKWLIKFFGKNNVFEIDKQEMYDMNSNIFSIDEHTVISEVNFTRLNNWLEELGFTVEKVNYREIAKQEGLLRCTTLPLIRD
jgi:N-dimethylarginine dimethylaminohydrolase